jgi:hypothetical protein
VSEAVPSRERLTDQIALVSALADYAHASAVRELAQVAIVRLSRRLTQKWELTDAEALKAAGPEALAAVASASGGGSRL